MPRKSKSVIELGLSEVEAYAVLSAIKTTLEVEKDFDSETFGFGAFAANLYRKSLNDVKDALEGALRSEPAPTN